jgi:RHS repeat-associated protein
VALPGGGGAVSFKYDPFGRRIQKSSPAGTINYVYDGANIVAEYDAAGTLQASYVQGAGIDQPLSLTRAAATSYYHADGLGSITSLTNSVGSIVATYSTDTFGRSLTSTGTIVNPFRYTAREWDSEIGAYYYRARYYHASDGRFLNEDPARWVAGVNGYLYVRNQAAILTDPTGLIDIPGGPQWKCLVCTVYAEARGLNKACQQAVASVILNRVGEARAKGRVATICSIVSAEGQFDGFGNKNYKQCMTCRVGSRSEAELQETIKNLSPGPISMLDGATFFGNNSAGIIRYFEDKVGLTRIPFSACPELVFYGDPGDIR